VMSATRTSSACVALINIRFMGVTPNSDSHQQLAICLSEANI
jgi:hypothetical protein